MLSMNRQPLVSVVTPVYNGEAFLGACIESVLAQTYQSFEYIIVNNCSTDRSLEIAVAYAAKDSRIRVHNNERFVGVIDNHNIAFELIAKDAKYCKVVSADDLLFPDCIGRMVELAEANPSVGIVGSYQLSGNRVRWQGFRYPTAVVSGAEICRYDFLGEDREFGFGSPTSILYRADLVRNDRPFYPNASPHADTSACFQQLQTCDFGFVYQILSVERIHPGTQTSISQDINRYSSAILHNLLHYGPLYLNKEELDWQVGEVLADYHRYLAVNYVIGFRSEEFWRYHRDSLAELGFPLRRIDLLKAVILKTLEEVANPGQAIAKLRRRVLRAPKRLSAELPQRNSTGHNTVGGGC
jgi:glycosyltransferase involved in cell wall biosynthesis